VAPTGAITVFAASSLTDAFAELGDAYATARPEASVTFNFAGSSQLATQITEGAPADVYASADIATMDKLVDAGAVSREPVVFATNLPEIIVAADNPLGIGSVSDLADPDLIVVTCAPQVPCGAYANRIFANAGLEVTPDSFEGSAKGVVTKVILGEADAGIAYATDVLGSSGQVTGVEIPEGVNVVAAYEIVVPADAPDPDGGQAFVDFVMSDAGQAIMSRYGFGSP
jgi:molybdate transport system substrate-binding protein